MIQCSCTGYEKGLPCNMVVNYHGTVTLADVVKSPPFESQPLEAGEHKHTWKIKEVEFGKKKYGSTS